MVSPLSPDGIKRYFSYDHLPAGLGKVVSQEVSVCMKAIDNLVPDGPEKTAGLRKLLEAKDCFVRASLPQ